MSHPIYHSISSTKKWGGKVEDYLPIHNWLDATKMHFSDMRHRLMRHHEEGIGWYEEKFGKQIINSDGESVSVKEVGEQHCREDVGFVPKISDYMQYFNQGAKLTWPKRHITIKDNYPFPNWDQLAVVSINRWGGIQDDYLPFYNWFEDCQKYTEDNRYQIFKYHAEGIFWAEAEFGVYFTNSAGRMVPVRRLCEYYIDHVIGYIPTIKEYLEKVAFVPWMFRSGEGRKVMQDIFDNKLDLIREQP